NRYEEALRENRELKRLLAVREPERAIIGSFAVAGGTGGVGSSQAVISGGRSDGIEPGQPVRSKDGLIGRTLEVGSRASRVLLVSDPESRVPVRVVRTGLPALAIGTNGPLIDVDLTGPTNNDVEPGDRIVTSGDGGLFAPGIPVGIIVNAEEAETRAEPAATPGMTTHVLVEAPFVAPVTEIPDPKELEAAADVPVVPEPIDPSLPAAEVPEP
ncbi:MAG: rod shape-determining protein MreC, partial [Pacificimonas sp.]